MGDYELSGVFFKKKVARNCLFRHRGHRCGKTGTCVLLFESIEFRKIINYVSNVIIHQDGVDYLYLADMGNNFEDRNVSKVLRFREPGQKGKNIFM